MPWLPGTPFRLQVLRSRVIAGPVQGIHQAVHSGAMGRSGNFHRRVGWKIAVIVLYIGIPLNVMSTVILITVSLTDPATSEVPQ